LRNATTIALAGFLLATGWAEAGPTKRDDKLDRKLKEVRSSYADKLEPVLVLCLEKGQRSRAEELLEKISRVAPGKSSLALLRARVEACEERPATEAVTKEIGRKLKAVGEAQAHELMNLAQKFYDREQVTRAYDLVGETLDACPDQRKARDLRGFEEVTVEKKKQWVTKYEAGLLKSGFVLFKNARGEPEGWVPRSERARWEKGERPFGGTWITAAEEASRRRASESDWFSVESEHFVVKTAVSRAAAYAFGQRLEEFHAPFFRAFISFYDPGRSTELLFLVPPLAKKHRVIYFPDAASYHRHVKECHGDNEILQTRSAGFYSLDGKGCDHASHFYRTESGAEDLSTIHHEVTHQLFDETSKELRGSSKGNNWVVEGLATYVETWSKDERGSWVPGGNVEQRRLQAAKRILDERPSWRLADFVAMGYDDFQAESVQQDNYALSCALVHFLMHADEGRYQEDAVRFFATYYAGRVTERSIFEALGVDEASLERQLRDYMAGLGTHDRPARVVSAPR